jgi:conjugal transfer pilus assembly protein TraV
MSGVSAAPGAAIRSTSRVLRVWIAPWEDSDGDLHEEALVHVLIDTGRWLIEHVRPAGRSRVDAVTPPSSPRPDGASLPASDEVSPPSARLPQAPGGSAAGIETAPVER